MGAEWIDDRYFHALGLTILSASIGTTVLFFLAVTAYLQRRSFRMLLITSAIGLLVARTLIGVGTMFGIIPMTLHHLVEHGFDFAIAALLLCAIYRAGPGRSSEECEMYYN